MEVLDFVIIVLRIVLIALLACIVVIEARAVHKKRKEK